VSEFDFTSVRTTGDKRKKIYINMSIRSTIILVVAVMAVATQSVYGADFVNGDQCGVTAEDMFKSDFAGEYLVAGSTGCQLEGGTQSNCYCAPNLKDGDRTSPFTWQCGGSVVFGPQGNKTCPAWATSEIPKNGVGERVQCDPAQHPGGRPGDEVCAYSDCDNGGTSSAICACIAPKDYAQGNTTASWVCLHSTCNCTKKEAASSATTASLSNIIGMTILSASALAVSIASL
jgi:hypothetical protein